jgi:hypothetical protein
MDTKELVKRVRSINTAMGLIRLLELLVVSDAPATVRKRRSTHIAAAFLGLSKDSTVVKEKIQ